MRSALRVRRHLQNHRTEGLAQHAAQTGFNQVLELVEVDIEIIEEFDLATAIGAGSVVLQVNSDTKNGLLGVLSTGQNIPVMTLTAGTSGATTWASKTADEIVADVTAMYAQVSKTTKDVERPDTLVLPTDVYTVLSLKRLGDTEATVLSYIKDHAPYLKEIISAAELNSDTPETNPYAEGAPGVATNAGQAVAFLFTNNPDKLEINIP